MNFEDKKMVLFMVIVFKSIVAIMLKSMMVVTDVTSFLRAYLLSCEK